HPAASRVYRGWCSIVRTTRIRRQVSSARLISTPPGGRTLVVRMSDNGMVSLHLLCEPFGSNRAIVVHPSSSVAQISILHSSAVAQPPKWGARRQTACVHPLANLIGQKAPLLEPRLQDRMMV